MNHKKGNLEASEGWIHKKKKLEKGIPDFVYKPTQVPSHSQTVLGQNIPREV